MAKIEIEVPKGKVGIVTKQADGNVLVTFENVEHWKFIKSIKDALEYLESREMCKDLIEDYRSAPISSYTEKVAEYRLIIAALTNNEERHLTTGERWFPVVQFCKPGKEKNCYGSNIIGYIESEGQKYTVVGGYASYGVHSGLGGFDSGDAVSYSWSHVGFRSVSRREIAEHLSKYFGRLLFEIDYAGVNCDWEWIN